MSKQLGVLTSKQLGDVTSKQLAVSTNEQFSEQFRKRRLIGRVKLTSK